MDMSITDWFGIAIMVSLEKMIKMVNYGNLTKIITQTLLIVGGVTCESLSLKLNYFGVDCMSVS
jgi:hypothetical protein